MRTFAWIIAAGAVVAGVWLVIDRQSRSPWVPDEFVIDEGEAPATTPDALPNLQKEAPAPAAGAQPAVDVRGPEPQPVLPSAVPGPIPSGPPPAPSAEPAQTQSSSPLSATARTQASGGGFYVQVGAFGETANAKRRAAELEELGFPVFSSAVDTADGRPATAVRLGPYSSRSEAVEAAARYVQENPEASTLIGEGNP